MPPCVFWKYTPAGTGMFWPIPALTCFAQQHCPLLAQVFHVR